MPKFDLWRLDTPSRATVDGSAAVLEMLEVLKSRADGIAQLRAHYPDAAFELALIAYVAYPGQTAPGLVLEPNVLAIVARLGLTLVIDYWVVEDETARAQGPSS